MKFLAALAVYVTLLSVIFMFIAIAGGSGALIHNLTTP